MLVGGTSLWVGRRGVGAPAYSLPKGLVPLDIPLFTTRRRLGLSFSGERLYPGLDSSPSWEKRNKVVAGDPYLLDVCNLEGEEQNSV